MAEILQTEIPSGKWDLACLRTTGFPGKLRRRLIIFRREVLAEHLFKFLDRGASMSISGILSSFSQNQVGVSDPYQKNTQQLSQALKSGNLTGAQSDFTTLQAAFSQSASTSTSTATSPMAQALSQLGSDLYSGDISAAQEDLPPFSRISGVTARLRPTTSTLALTLAAAGKLPVLRT
jgi:hypothetical protein